jgi:hypothetical protein
MKAAAKRALLLSPDLLVEVDGDLPVSGKARRWPPWLE